jgi:hypothetical protein
MEDARFFQKQANRCYQLAWQSFDLQVAHRLNALGNEHKVKARELGSKKALGEETGQFKEHPGVLASRGHGSPAIF